MHVLLTPLIVGEINFYVSNTVSKMYSYYYTFSNLCVIKCVMWLKI